MNDVGTIPRHMLDVRELTAEAFAPYGQVIAPLRTGGQGVETRSDPDASASEAKLVLDNGEPRAGKSQALHLVRAFSAFTVAPSAESGNKLTRFGPFSSQCCAGNVKILRGLWNEDLFRVLEGFPDLAHDDEVDACSGALEMLNPEMKGWGIFEFYRQRAEQLQQRKRSWVRLRAPRGVGSVQTYSGRHLNIREDGTVDMSAEDAEYLTRNGWTKLAEWESGEDM